MFVLLVYGVDSFGKFSVVVFVDIVGVDLDELIVFFVSNLVIGGNFLIFCYVSYIWIVVDVLECDFFFVLGVG